MPKEVKDDDVATDLEPARKAIKPANLKSAKQDIANLEHPEEHEWDDLIPHVQGCCVGCVGEYLVYMVCADQVMVHYAMDWTTGGNHSRWPFIPEGQLWLSHDLDVHEASHDCLHEWVECTVMDELKWGYDKAHKTANAFEKEYMKELGLGGEIKPKPDYNTPGRSVKVPWEKY